MPIPITYCPTHELRSMTSRCDQYYITIQFIQWKFGRPGEVTGEVDRLLRAVVGEMTRQHIQAALGLKSEAHFRTAYLKPALQAGVVEMTLPDKPNSRSQRYRLTPLGQRWLQALPSTAKPAPPHP